MNAPYSTIGELVRDAIGATGEETYESISRLIVQAGGPAAAVQEAVPLIHCLAEIALSRQSVSSRRDDACDDDEDEAAGRQALLKQSIRYFVEAMTTERSLVIVIDGLQWADKPSLNLLEDVMESSDALPILVVFATRPDERVERVLEGSVRIELGTLSAEEQLRLVETRFAVRHGAREICTELLPRVGGNPFYLLEMVDALLERGVLEIRDDALLRASGKVVDASTLPSTLEQLLADRIHELPAQERLIVDWLAVAGGPLELTDLARLLERSIAPQADVGDAPTQSSELGGFGAREDASVRLCARGLCDQRGESLDFRHALTRDVAYAALEPRIRVRMHRQLGLYLAQTPEVRGRWAAIVARHLELGEVPDRAAEYYVEAGTAARNAYQIPIAIECYLRAAARIALDHPKTIEVHSALEAMFRVLGRRADRVRHLEEMRASARLTRAASSGCLALLRSARFALDEGRLTQGLPMAIQAARVARDIHNAAFETEAERLVSELSREMGDVHGALRAIDRALAACESPTSGRRASAVMRADVLRTRGVLLRRVGRVDEALQAHVEAIGVCRCYGVRRQEARSINALAYAMIVQGRYEDAIALAMDSLRIDLSIGGRFQVAKTLTNIGYAYTQLGDTPRALAYLDRAGRAHDRYEDLDGRANTWLVTAETWLDVGDLEKAETFLRQARALIEQTSNAYDCVHADVVNAELARQRGDASSAAALALQAQKNAAPQMLVSFQWNAVTVEASARLAINDVHHAFNLATTALGAVEALQGSEYGLQIRAHCASILLEAGSPKAGEALARAFAYADGVRQGIRDPRLKKLFADRPVVKMILQRSSSLSIAQGVRE